MKYKLINCNLRSPSLACYLNFHFKPIHQRVVYLNQRLANFFNKGSDRKYSRLCGWDIWTQSQLPTAVVVANKQP